MKKIIFKKGNETVTLADTKDIVHALSKKQDVETAVKINTSNNNTNLEKGITIVNDGSNTNYDISITADKNIITKNETSTLTAILTDDSTPISGKTLVFDDGHNRIPTITDSNGKAVFKYIGEGKGKIDYIVSYGNFLQETFVLIDGKLDSLMVDSSPTYINGEVSVPQLTYSNEKFTAIRTNNVQGYYLVDIPFPNLPNSFKMSAIMSIGDYDTSYSGDYIHDMGFALYDDVDGLFDLLYVRHQTSPVFRYTQSNSEGNTHKKTDYWSNPSFTEYTEFEIELSVSNQSVTFKLFDLNGTQLMSNSTTIRAFSNPRKIGVILGWQLFKLTFRDVIISTYSA